LSSLAGGDWLGGLIALVAFAAAHVPFWGWGPALTVFATGGVLTLLYVWKRDLPANIIAHVASNVMALAILPLLSRLR